MVKQFPYVLHGSLVQRSQRVMIKRIIIWWLWCFKHLCEVQNFKSLLHFFIKQCTWRFHQTTRFSRNCIFLVFQELDNVVFWLKTGTYLPYMENEMMNSKVTWFDLFWWKEWKRKRLLKVMQKMCEAISSAIFYYLKVFLEVWILRPKDLFSQFLKGSIYKEVSTQVWICILDIKCCSVLNGHFYPTVEQIKR